MRTQLAVSIILIFATFGGVVAGSVGQPVDLGIEDEARMRK